MKLLTFTGAVISGIGLGIVIAVLLTDKFGFFCPVCNGKLVLENNQVVCKSCGARSVIEEA